MRAALTNATDTSPSRTRNRLSRRATSRAARRRGMGCARCRFANRIRAVIWLGLRVLDARVVDAQQHAGEHRFNLGQVAQRQIALIELAVDKPRVDDLAHEPPD